jgi:hypothetical protein
VVEWCEHLYDFGDDWTHDVKLTGVVSDKEAFKRRLLDGEREGPPEDSGGAPGYHRMMHLVETGKDIYDDDADNLRAWLGGRRPDGFDVAKAKARFDR